MKQLNNWNYAVQKMIDWIDANITEALSLTEMSKQLGFSTYYCSNKFHEITGITLKKYIATRRLYHASLEIRDTNSRILDIAVKYGFSSQEAFTRAFANAYSCTPYAYRKSPKPMQIYPKQTVVFSEFNIDNEGNTMMKTSEKLEIQKAQKVLYDQYGESVLNILNGQMMYDNFKEHKLMEYGGFAPFNEAMCVGDTVEDIFSPEFIACRLAAHKVTLEQYKQITLEPLQELFNGNIECIVLWFGDDMFCQINFLTVLAYLEQINFRGKIFFNLVRENTMEIERFEVAVKGYKELYNKAVVYRELPDGIPLPVLYNGIRLYLEYLNEENEITLYIKNHLGLSENVLMKRLFKIFPQYGLGDTQYMELIRNCKRASGV